MRARTKAKAVVLGVVAAFAILIPTAASAGTWEYTVYLSKVAGYTHWTYAHEVLWTGNGSTISAYSVDDWNQYHSFGYYWEDRADGSTFTYTDSGVQYKRKQTNGYYKLGICPACDHDYPYIKTTVGAGGQHWKNSSGF